MATKRTLSEAETLEQYRISLENVVNQPKISSIMSEFGYDTESINEGKALLEETRTVYDKNKIEDDETSAAYDNFDKIKAQLEDRYSLDRKKAKAILRKEPLLLEKLGIIGATPKAYIKWLETIKKYYATALSDSDIQLKLGKLKITTDYLAETEQLIKDLENARAEYKREVGESQDATKDKDAAFAKIDDWMSEFYAIANIALEEDPQLLESLGKFVRS